MTDTKEEQKLDLASFLSSVRLETEVSDPTPMITEQLTSSQEDVSEEERFLSSMAAVVFNMEDGEGRFDKSTIQSLIGQIDGLIADQMDEILHNEKFQEMESAWTSVADLVGQNNFRANIGLSLLDVSKDEAFEDLEMNVADIGGSELFKKIYVAEYDQYGGHPFGGVVGLYDFANTRKDILWLKSMGKIATASHAPFVGAVNPKFFGCDTAKEMGGLRDIAGMIDTPKYSAWNDFRDSEEAAYIGLTMPRFILREPY
ncbi:MAG: type VI secretion system contractile sheath large subunit, partial [Myxococcota bacterium]|nr:type VI secretion system contractile sheath large subunit [Myxococcota bacterium]